MVETPAGMLNAVGLQNKGVDYFIERIYPRIKDYKSRLIVNVSGANVDDYAETARRLHPLDGVKAIEVNISCPNVKEGGMAFGTTTNGAASVTRAVRQAYPDKTLIVKLSPNVTSIADIARAVEAEGADSVRLSTHSWACRLMWKNAVLICRPSQEAFPDLRCAPSQSVWFGKWQKP